MILQSELNRITYSIELQTTPQQLTASIGSGTCIVTIPTEEVTNLLVLVTTGNLGFSIATTPCPYDECWFKLVNPCEPLNLGTASPWWWLVLGRFRHSVHRATSHVFQIEFTITQNIESTAPTYTCWLDLTLSKNLLALFWGGAS